MIRGPHIRTRGGEMLVDGRYMPIDEVLVLVREALAARARRQPALPVVAAAPTSPRATAADARRAIESLRRAR